MSLPRERDRPDPSLIISGKRKPKRTATSNVGESQGSKKQKTGQDQPAGTGNNSDDEIVEVQNPARTEQIPTSEAKSTNNYSHRHSFPGRPSAECAADHPRWKGSESLAYTFLLADEFKTDEDTGKLQSARLRCAWCVASQSLLVGTWTWTVKTAGSTSNFLKHFSAKHSNAWDAAKRVDAAVLQPNKPATDGTGPIESAFASVCLPCQI